MSENAAKVGQRIRRLREQRGWSQSDLATRLGRTQTAVSYWEAGRRAPGIDDLLDVAQALEVATSELLPDRLHRRPVQALLRAVAEQVDSDQLAKDLEEFAVTAQQLPRPEIQWRIAPGSPRDTADALLAAAGVTEPPVLVRDLAAGCGVRILSWNFDNIDGLVVELDDGPAIWVNPDQVQQRQRFTLAHELGHHLLRHADRFHVDFGGDLGPSASGEHPGYDWRAERAANDFAANLLMPAAMVRSAFKQDDRLGWLASRFKVSTAAMGIRLTNLRLR